MACEGWGDGEHCKVPVVVGDKEMILEGIVRKVNGAKHQILVEFSGPYKTLATGRLLEERSNESHFWVDAHTAKK